MLTKRIVGIATALLTVGVLVAGCGSVGKTGKPSSLPVRTNLNKVLKNLNLPAQPSVQYVPPADVPKFKMIEANFLQAFAKDTHISVKKFVLNKYPNEVQGVSEFLSNPSNATMVSISYPFTSPWTDYTSWVQTDAIIQVNSQNIPQSVQEMVQSIVQALGSRILSQWHKSPVIYVDVSYSKNGQNLAWVIFWEGSNN